MANRKSAEYLHRLVPRRTRQPAHRHHHSLMHLTSSVAQTIIQSVELTSILVPSRRLRIIALLSSGCRATVESVSNVRSSSTTHSGRDNCTCRVGRVQRIFTSSQLKVIPLFRYSVFRVLQRPHSNTRCVIKNIWFLFSPLTAV